MQMLLTAKVGIHTQQQTGEATVVWPQYTRNTDVGHFGNILGALCVQCVHGRHIHLRAENKPIRFKVIWLQID